MNTPDQIRHMIAFSGRRLRRMPAKPPYNGRPNADRAKRASGSMRRFVAVMSVLFPK